MSKQGSYTIRAPFTSRENQCGTTISLESIAIDLLLQKPFEDVKESMLDEVR
eukprot:m.382883 g.382883  ORF g.382883 m.382883 type:complete len:52 (-) comp56253_c1_seq37:104-259(-)